MNIKNQIREFIENNFMVQLNGEYDDNDSLLEKGIIDSTGVLELVMYLEENFQIKVKDEEILPDNFDSVNNIENYLFLKLNRNGQ